MVDSGWDRRVDDKRVLAGVGMVAKSDELAFALSEDDHDRIGHGTICTVCLHEVACAVRVIPLRVFGQRLETSAGTITAAIQWSVTQEIRLLNLSLGTSRDDGKTDLYRACRLARNAGTIIVAASNPAGTSYPSAFDNVISVGLGPFRSPLEFTFRKDHLVECLASGECGHTVRQIVGRTIGAGSSIAAARVTGIIALMLERWPHLDTDGVRVKLARYSSSLTGRGNPITPPGVWR